MNNIRWMLSIFLCLCISFGLSACTMSSNNLLVTELKDSSSEPVTLVGYLIGTAPLGLPEVLKELNKKMEVDMNARLELHYIEWANLAALYPLVLSSEGNVDFIFTGNWAFYSQEATKGSFREITEDMVKKYMPLHDKATSAIAWEQARVGGKVYMIPSSTPDLKVPVTLIRDDLRKKYGLPAIKKLSELEPFLAKVKSNEFGMVPIHVDKQYDFIKTHESLAWELGPATIDVIMTTNGFSGVFTDWDDPSGKLQSIFDEPLKSNYLEVAKIIKSWYDKGYINSDAFANKIRSKDLFEQGKSAVAYGNSNDIQSTIAKAEQMGWEIAIIPNLSPNNTYIMDPYINNGVAIPTDSKHTELTLQVLDLIMEDPEYNQLVYYGIEGENYVIENGEIGLPVGMSSGVNNYPPDAAGFWFTNKDQLLPIATWSDNYTKHKAEINGMLIPFVYSAFNFNAVPVQREMDQVNQAAIQYLNPILSGMVNDVDLAFQKAESEILKAGFTKVLEEAQKQTREYINNYEQHNKKQ